ncbi:MAG TPA: hypothetical protein PLO51_01145 [Candidatus Micrarchaeota archaeon]|nr:hypothetical protein [Candidatus Micrarchaeota archaeon]
MEDMLISTDVYNIISLLRAKHHTSLDEIAAELKMPKSEVRKWASVLEAQGMVKIDHRMMREYIMWQGEPEPESKKAQPDKKQSVSASPLDLSIVEAKAQEAARIPGPSLAISRARDAPRESQPETQKQFDEIEHARSMEGRIRQSMARLEEAQETSAPVMESGEEEKTREEPNPVSRYIKHIASAKSRPIGKSIQARKAMQKQAAKKAMPKIIAKKAAAKERPAMQKKIAIEPRRAKVTLGSAVPRAMPARQAPMPKPEKKIITLSDMLSAQMEKIRTQEERISSIKEEKAGLLVKHLEPVERKLEAEIETVSDKLLEKQRIILELEKQATGIPEIVEGIDQKNAKISEVEEEARKALDNARIELEDILSELEGIKSLSQDRMDELEKTSAAANAKLEGVKKSHENIDKLIETANGRIEATRAAVEEQVSRLEEVESQMDSLEEYKKALEDDMAQAAKAIERQKNLARVLAEHTGTIEAVEGYTRRQFEEYEKQVEALSELSASNERDFAALRESVETSFVRRYVSELSGILRRHEYEIGQAVEAEKGIDARIEIEKAKLKGLIDEGKEMAQMLGGKESSLGQDEVEGMLRSKQEKIEIIAQRIKNRAHISQAAREALAKLEREDKESKD